MLIPVGHAFIQCNVTLNVLKERSLWETFPRKLLLGSRERSRQECLFARPHCEDELSGVEMSTGEQKDKKKTSNIWRGKAS